MPLSPGDKLGPYEILSAIGAGGMGEVYKARDTRLDRTVAIKVLPAHIAQRDESLARFEREARAVAGLNHPNICTLHDIGAGYMVMELIEGETLADRIAKGPIPLDQALKFATQIADALDRAHRAGVTHRDVKPQNIMLTRDGVKVLDFGLAKSQSSPGPTEATLTKVLTTEGTVLGTPQYMAPEQFEGREADARSDIWAFGAVLYEMVTGQKAFQGKSYASLLGAILSADPAPMSVTPFTPSWLERLVRRCLAKDPDDRYQSIRDVVLELRHPPEESAASAPTQASKWPWVVAALAVAAVLATLWAVPRSSAARPLVMLDLDVGTEVTDPAVSPDGQRVAFVANRQLAYRDLSSPTIRYLARTEGATHPFFSPDGKSLGYFANNLLTKISLDGGAPASLCPLQSPVGAFWGEDGVIYVKDQYGISLLRVPSAGGKCETTTLTRDKNGQFAPLRTLPGGKYLLTEFDSDIVAEPIAGGERRILVKDANSPRFLPATGTLIFHKRGILYGIRLKLPEPETSGTPVVLAEGIKTNESGRVSMDASGTSGTLAYRQTNAVESVVSWLEPDGTVKPLVDRPGQYRHVRFSPNGALLAISMRSSTSGDAQMLVYDQGTRQLRGLLEQRGGGNRDFPVWSPDSETLVMRADDSLISFDLPANSKSEIQQATILPWSFAPDGGTLLAADSTNGGERLRRRLRLFPVRKTANGLRYGPPREWAPLPGDNAIPAISPDGKWVAFSYRLDSGDREIFVVPYLPDQGPATRKWQVSSGGGNQSQWGKNELFFCSPDNHVMVAPYSVKDGVFMPGRPRRWSEHRTSSCGFDVTPDGKRVAAVVDREEQKPVTHLQILLNVADELERRLAGAK